MKLTVMPKIIPVWCMKKSVNDPFKYQFSGKQSVRQQKEKQRREYG
jgi:hypothetical protein